MLSISFFEFFALFLGFYMAWNIGANDVANAMGTSVGSKALTIGKAVVLAAILEFSGAFFAGAKVSETIQQGIIDPHVFAMDPMTFVLGMLSVLLSTGILLQVASYFALPVSTTHAIVGSVLGFGVFVGGVHAVNWVEVGWISLSWVFSPLCSGVIAYVLFAFIQRLSLVPSYMKVGVPIMHVLFARRLPPLPVLTTGYGQESALSSEKGFVFLQILSASLVAFAHGANDVSNAIGPVSAIFSALKTGVAGGASKVPVWLLAFGGVGMVAGLATWGWRVIETVGKKITELTPRRGFAAEFGTALTVLSASKLGLPVSTTHALIGAIVGVGLVGGAHTINFTMFRGILISWAVTLPLCSLCTVIVFYILKSFLLST